MTARPVAYRLDHSAGAPLHVQAERFLRSLMAQREFANGGLLPDEISLARRLGISRGTLRGALQRLVHDGLLERKSGVGTRVKRQKVQSGIGSWCSFTREMAQRGIQVENFAETRRMVATSAAVARELRIEAGRKVLLADRVRGWEGMPIGHFRSYFHPRLGLDPTITFDRPLYELIEEKCSVVVDRSDEEFSAVAADRRLAAALKIRPGDPLLRRVRTVYDTGGRPMEYAIVHYRSDRFALTLSLAKEPR